MADNKPIHIVPLDGGSVNVREGSNRALDKGTTTAQVQAPGRQRAITDKVEHLVHNKDGQIGSRNSYGNDPRRSKG
jgi:hypothetical protein